MKKIKLKQIDAIFLDFDGVLTDNSVITSSLGKEYVACSRSDGIAANYFRKIKKPIYIVSSEKNNVVKYRAKKMKITCFNGITDKKKFVIKFCKRKSFTLSKILFVGNDINDFQVMKVAGLSACPADSHKKIKNISNIVLKKNGGKGILRELLEEIFNIDLLEEMYNKQL